MLRIFGNPKTLCDGLTRRDFLHVGGLGVFGLGLDDLFRLRQAQGSAPADRGGVSKIEALPEEFSQCLGL